MTYKKTMQKVGASDELKQETFNKLVKQHKVPAQEYGENKTRKRYKWNTRRGIVAAATAAVMILCAIFIPLMVINDNGGGGGELTQKEKMKAMFENAVYIPDLSDIMPASAMNIINSNEESASKSSSTQSNASHVSALSAGEIKSIDVSEIKGDKMLYHEFESFMNIHRNIKNRSDAIKINSVSYLQYIDDFNFGEWKSFNHNQLNNVKYEQLENGIAFYYAYMSEQPYFIKVVVYNDGRTECLYWTEVGGEHPDGNYIEYFSYNGMDSFNFISEYPGGTAKYIDLKKQGEEFSGVDVFLSKDGANGHNQIQFMKGDKNEFNVLWYDSPFGESTWTAYSNFFGVKNNSAYSISYDDGSNGCVNKGMVTISFDAIEGIEKVYYSEHDADGLYVDVQFEALKLTDGTLFDNTYYNGLYGYYASLRRSNEVCYGGLNIFLLEFNGEYGDVIAKYNAALPEGMKIKESKAFDFTVYPVMVAEIESYKITGIEELSGLILIKNGDALYAKITELLASMRFDVL